MYFRLDQKFTGTTGMDQHPAEAQLPPARPVPCSYEFKDQDTVAVNVRVQRNF